MASSARHLSVICPVCQNVVPLTVREDTQGNVTRYCLECCSELSIDPQTERVTVVSTTPPYEGAVVDRNQIPCPGCGTVKPPLFTNQRYTFCVCYICHKLVRAASPSYLPDPHPSIVGTEDPPGLVSESYELASELVEPELLENSPSPSDPIRVAESESSSQSVAFVNGSASSATGSEQRSETTQGADRHPPVEGTQTDE